ncbi:MAG: flavin reductase family protein [Desulfobacteraceae bacterium]|nr:flavin reductase family protein [Desulfobacteraceae bacterium]
MCQGSANSKLIANCVACFECNVVDRVETGDHTIFVGHILTGYVSDARRRCMLYDFGKGVLRGLK